jgi:hypothetical protein
MDNEFSQNGPNQTYTDSGAQTDSGLKAQAQQKLQTVRARATDQITQRVTEQKGRTADTLSTVAQSLHQTSQLLRDQNEESMSRYVDRAADQVDRLAGYLQTTDIDEVMDNVEELARRRPGVFIGGAFAIGFLASRFIKASRRNSQGGRSYDESYRSYDGDYLTGGYDTARGYNTSADTYRTAAVQPASEAASYSMPQTGDIEIGNTRSVGDAGRGDDTADGGTVSWEAPRG